MEDYINSLKPNSHKYKEEQARKEAEKKKVEKVVSGTVKVKKKSELGKFKDLFISDDAANIKSFIFMDVLIPAAKKAVSDIVTNGIDMLLYGGNGGGKRKSTADRVTYTSYYDQDRRDRGYREERSRGGYMQDEIYFKTRGDAERVLDELKATISRYGIATVSDLNEMAGVTGQHTDNKYGWSSLRNAYVERTIDGYYYIKLPKAMPID